MAKLKKSKRDKAIQYQNKPHDGERCGLCTMYRSPNQCTDVAGYILLNGWCKIFVRKEKREKANEQ
jgi:hypothetical protein